MKPSDHIEWLKATQQQGTGSTTLAGVLGMA
jgi:hypothetical protein